MKDGLLRRIVKRIARWRYAADLAATRAIRRLRGEAPRYLLRGACTGCGVCCETPMIRVSAPTFYLKTLRRPFLAWQRIVNGFVHVGEDRPTRTLIFRCTHLDPETRRCDAYDSRPGLCRDYPRNLLDAPAPRFLDGCGHYALSRNAERIRASFERLDLPPEKMAELERRFFIREGSYPAHDASSSDSTPVTGGDE